LSKIREQGHQYHGGQPIRFPVEKNARFVQATQEQLKEEIFIDDSSIKLRPHGAFR